MPDKPASERTEAPTPERLRKARQEGRIPQSQEVSPAIGIGILLVVLGLMGATVYRWFVTELQSGMSLAAPKAFDASFARGLLMAKLTGGLVTAAPFLLAGAAASVMGSLISGGWAYSPKAVKFDIGRISPVTGLKNLISMKSFVRLLVSLVKLAAIVIILYFYLHDRLGQLIALRWASSGGMLAGTAQLAFGAIARIAIALCAIACIDMLYQRWNYKREMRMTRQELKEERKQYELSPEIRSRIRAVQIEMARKRMLDAVPQADMVLANPTHVAAALRYDSSRMEAPYVVAKGADLLAEKIKEIARTHGVPIVHRPELARSIYHGVDVGQPIPEVLFVAVAEVLAMIFRLRKRRQEHPSVNPA